MKKGRFFGFVLAGAITLLLGSVSVSAGDQTFVQSDGDVEVHFTRSYEGNEESAYIQAFSEGSLIWDYQTDSYSATELSRTAGIGLNNGMYYLKDGTKGIVTLDEYTGDVCWENDEYVGSPAQNAYCFMKDGTLLISGYYGPDLFAVSEDGVTLGYCESFRENYYWPVKVELVKDTVFRITYENYPQDAGKDYLTFNYEDFIGAYGTSNAGKSASKDSKKSKVSTLSTDIISNIYGTSCLSEYDMTHWAKYAIDGASDTAWVEGASGQGIGEKLCMELDGNYTLNGFVIRAGYQKNSDIYYKNSRPSQLTVLFGDGSSETFQLLDVMDKQTFKFSSPVSANQISFRIDGVYAGNKYEDTCISELRLF